MTRKLPDNCIRTTPDLGTQKLEPDMCSSFRSCCERVPQDPVEAAQAVLSAACKAPGEPHSPRLIQVNKLAKLVRTNNADITTVEKNIKRQ
ncbi:hypothetical protein NDU88_001986 [Pleurodeles waltl]|uniref:Uncharacterized protein n=1 Tax=Pleurodeles waltl TaxID=8319 RepID=A0AAV7T146_PLEWA|nr:hypothetical protein NDU88_001986 [Pleurodeles waltl]